VGIGKSPASGFKLDVDGHVRGTIFTSTTEDVAPFQVSSLVRVDNLNASLLDGLGKGAFMRTDEDTSTLFNVGIGTTPSVSYKLDVDGQVRASIPTAPGVASLLFGAPGIRPNPLAPPSRSPPNPKNPVRPSKAPLVFEHLESSRHSQPISYHALPPPAKTQ